MAKSTQVLVTPAQVTLQTGGPRLKVRVPSAAAVGVYVGGDENSASDPTKKSGASDTLSATTGYLIAPGGGEVFDIGGNESLLAVSASATVSITVHVFKSNARYA